MILPVLDFFPLSEGEYDRRTLELQEYRKQMGWPTQLLPPKETAYDALDFVKIAASRNAARSNCFDFDLDGKLKSGVYREWVSLMPPLRDGPQISNYRKTRYDERLLDAEMIDLPTLSSGQVIFHGGQWPGKLELNAEIIVDIPLSTTLNAFRAVWFADEAYRRSGHERHIWLISIRNGFSTPVYVYNTFSNRSTGHEVEVLIRRGFSAALRSIEDFNGYKILKVEFY